REKSGGKLDPTPAQYTWVPWKPEIGKDGKAVSTHLDMLVMTPEKPLVEAMNRITRKASDKLIRTKTEALTASGMDEGSPAFSDAMKTYRASPEYMAAMDAVRATPDYEDARKKADDAIRDELFTGDMLVRTEIQHRLTEIVVAFEFKR